MGLEITTPDSNRPSAVGSRKSIGSGSFASSVVLDSTRLFKGISAIGIASHLVLENSQISCAVASTRKAESGGSELKPSKEKRDWLVSQTYLSSSIRVSAIFQLKPTESLEARLMGATTAKRLGTTSRYMMQNAKQSVRDICDAITELVTNVDDRYQILGKAGRIEIEIERHRGSPHILRVRDFADGMTSDTMDLKLSNFWQACQWFGVRRTSSRDEFAWRQRRGSLGTGNL